MERKFSPIESVIPSALAMEYDKEHFASVKSELSNEFARARPENQRSILIDRFVDGASIFLQTPNTSSATETNLFEKYGMRPMKIDLAKMAERKSLEVSKYRTALFGKEEKHFHPDSQGLVYGPSHLYNVAPNELLTVELNDQDVVSTLRLSSCTALVLREKNKVTVAHVTSPSEVFDASKAMIASAHDEDSEITVIAPEYKAIPGDAESEQFAARLIKERDELMKKIKDEAESAKILLKIGGYPYISAGIDRDRRVSEAAMIVGKDFCATIGYSWSVDKDNKRQNKFFTDTTRLV